MQTARISLVQPLQDDYDDILSLHNHDEVRKYLGGPVVSKDFERSFQNMLSPKKPNMHWVVRNIESDAFMGLVSIDEYHDGKRYEMSYQLLPGYWGKGYAQEVCKRIIEYAFNEAGFDQIVSETQMRNESSINLLERLGMKLESTVERFGEQQAVYVLKDTNS
jgi:ribosomal-protein-alanine N-acetyltransferase